MLFLFRGKNGPLVRVIIGAILLVVGTLAHGWLILAAIGAILLIWGAIGLVAAQRIRHQDRLHSQGRNP
jgi:uncharacterized membrane protein HdeD (DUF308 family)